MSVKIHPSIFYATYPLQAWWHWKRLADGCPKRDPPKCRLCAVQPVVLRRAVAAAAAATAAVLISVITPQPDPEVSIGGPQIRDELLDDLLLGSRLHAEKLAAIPAAGQVGLSEIQPSPQLGEIGQLVTRPAVTRLAYTLTCIHVREFKVYIRSTWGILNWNYD